MSFRSNIFGQRNQTVAPGEPNTFIGGIAASIPTSADLAAKLFIFESDISFFEVRGNDIAAAIEVDFIIPTDSFAYSPLTYFYSTKAASSGERAFRFSAAVRIDLPAATFLGAHSLYGMDNLKVASLPLMTSCGTALFYSSTALKIVNIPRTTDLGGSPGNTLSFFNIPGSAKIYAHPSLQTNNSGGEDGDIAYARGRGVAIVYVTNLTAPNAIADLSTGTKYATAIHLSFTPPSSVNAIEFYEVYVDGVYNGTFNMSGEVYALGLSPSSSYDISVVAVDQYYNKSAISNIVTTTTNATEDYNINDIAAYYRLDSNAKDVFLKDGIPTGVSYSVGYAVFNGSAKISLPQNILNNPTEFSATFLVQANNTTSEYRVFSLNNNTGGAYVSIRLNRGGVANRITAIVNDGTDREITTDAYLTTGLLHVGISAIKNDKFELYLNGGFVGSYSTLGSFSQISSPGNYLGAARNGTVMLKGKMRGVAIWNKALTASEALAISTKQLSGQQIL